MHILYRQVPTESGSCRRRDIPHAKLSLGEILQAGDKKPKPELDIHEL